MRYGINILPACVVLAHLAGTTLAIPVLNDCPNDDSPSLIKRDAEPHVSIPHVVANFEPQPSGSPPASSSSSEGMVTTHRLQKRADPWGKIKKTLGKFTQKVCGTGGIKKEALENSMLRQSNAGISQQDVIAPEGFEEDVLAPMIDLGDDNQGGNVDNQGLNNQVQTTEIIVEEEEEKEQDPDEFDSPPINRRRRQSIRARPGTDSNTRPNSGMSRFGTDEDIRGMISRLPENPVPVKIEDTELFQQRVRNLDPIPEQALERSLESLPRGSIQLGQSGVLPQGSVRSGQGSVRSGQGSGETGTEIGDPNDLLISLSESMKNPFIPGEKGREFYREERLWPEDELVFSDEEADVAGVGQTGMNDQPQNNQGEDKMRKDIDISPYTEHPGVLDYLRGQRGKNVVVVDPNAPEEKKESFFRRIWKGRYKEPEKVLNTGPRETLPSYDGPIVYQPGWVVNPAEVMAETAARERDEERRKAALGLAPEVIERQRIQRQKLERAPLDRMEQQRRAQLFDQLYPEGDEGEIYIPSNEEQSGGNNNLDEQPDILTTAQIFTENLEQPQIRQNVLGRPQIVYSPSNQQEIGNGMNQAQVVRGQMNQPQVLGGQMNQPQIQYPEGGIDVQLGSPVRSTLADQDIDEQDINYASFARGHEEDFGPESADFTANQLKDSIRSQGWNLGVSRISPFPIGEDGQVQYPPYIEGESREEDPEEYMQLADLEGVRDTNFSFANPNLLASLRSGGSQESQGSQVLQASQGLQASQESQSQGQAPQ
ncbi:hypothetical protein AOL_s00083g319 [Orbilia oligospora ATCC 24927]|uniref:Uncharacterized protein n=1 Tax=Arthrobotrys oligospora (strain ATCC 24927 / CBS 115.81 / DSM 1491) TaxID=756982 RepID=G1XH38_ARTOA|nr:hypothetical protein AOL_s00083g319 [Orbilia oligospora ATCC 24927]EGX47510.1 hypothetical protein AOL_s00083g319 [Orbilia oligospora ATCC 24927]